MGTFTKIGLLCLDDLEEVGHINFDNFRKAFKNYFTDSSFIDIISKEQLPEIDLLIIVDEHFIPHVNVWKNDDFINTLNELNLKVLLFNIEKIFSSQFPWNADHQRKVETINNSTQLFSDLEDRKIKEGLLNKHGLLSKSHNCGSIPKRPIN